MGRIIERYRQGLLAKSPDAPGVMAVACYQACYSEPIYYLDDTPILSFAWILADYLPPLNTEPMPSFTDRLTEQAMAWLKSDLLDGDHISAHLERLQFCTLLRDNLQRKLAVPVNLTLGGSSALGLAAPGSNLDLQVETGNPEALLVALKELFPTAAQTGAEESLALEFRGQPYAFTLKINSPVSDSSVPRLRRLFTRNPPLYLLSLLLVRWARANQLIRRNLHQSSQLSVTALCLQITLSLEESCLTDGQGCLPNPADELQRMERMLAGPIPAFGRELMEMLEHLATNGTLSCLRDQAHRAIHLLAQSANLTSLWDCELSGNTLESSVKSVPRPRLLRRPIRHRSSTQEGESMVVTSASYFMEGASLLLLSGSQSELDTVMFDLYQGRRRPQHADTQCYLPLIMPSTTLPSLNLPPEDHVYAAFLTHAYRQFDLVRRLGSADYGPLKLVIKFGHFYLTNLPRLFMEEGMAATVQTVRKALSLGYKTMSEVSSEQLLRAEAGAEAFEPLKADGESDEDQQASSSNSSNAASVNASPQKPPVPVHGLEPKSMKPLVRRKATLTPLSSSFEPAWHGGLGEEVEGGGRLRRLLELLAYEPIPSVQNGYAVSLCLFNKLTHMNHGIQCIYSEQMQLLRISHRPIRWMSVDVRGNANQIKVASPLLSPLVQTTEDPALDLRLVLSSTRPMGPLEDSDLAEQLQAGVIQVEAEGVIRVKETFRTNPTVFCRHSVTHKWQPTAQSLAAWHRLGLPTLPPSHPLPQLHLVQVTEYSQPSTLTGLFELAPQEKDEIELYLPLEWNQQLGGGDFIRGVWTVAHALRMFI